MPGFFFNLGRMIGPKVRQAKWMVNSLAGSETDAIRSEVAVGQDLALALTQQMEIERSPEPRLAEVVARLASRVENRHWQFTVQLVNTPEVNAFALPGGFIFVTRPLLELCGWDRDETAFVVGHEMGHVLRHHAIDRLMANTLISSTLARLPIGRGLLRTPLAGLMTSLLNQGYSQDQELDADALGVQLAQAAGFDASAARRLLARLGGAAFDAGLLGSYFSSHPPLDVRIRNVERLLKN